MVDQWLSIGLAVGLDYPEIEARTHVIPSASSKLEAIIELLERERGVKEAEKALLRACKVIPNPIYGSVLYFVEEGEQSSAKGISSNILLVIISKG
jgi:hypothetical protein